ncbi:MAG TPA: hypothetical protein VLC07_03585 [Solirubrobacterales bacterium]|nr:hypothetical protein [Solirubrobacterales bacterium]
MTAALVLTPEEALRVIAEAPDSADKTPEDLRNAAEEYEREADRKDRIAAGASNGNRAKARAKARERKGDRLRLHAQVCRSAAAEIEARDCPTVGEANKSAVVRAMRKALRKNGNG